mmetsp:Transcript_37370/g.97967  ORF Transcript_37370/g.97967 Transcript_37370/m.97967 type:complete len:256 (-) Transcript_37370:66-833(-)
MAAAKAAVSGAAVLAFPSKGELSKQLGKAVAAASAAAGPTFTVAISGGSLPKLLAAGLVGPDAVPEAAGIDWAKWHVFFADERHVALDHDDSNYLACKQVLFDKVPIKPEQIYAIDAAVPVADAAKKYEADLKSVFGDAISAAAPPAFDLILLGMGPDGHTASLFPGHALLAEASALVAPITDSPKPPPERITLSLPAINAAKAVAFVCTGASKALNLAKILSGQEPLPAGLVVPKAGTLTWFVDDDAAAEWSKM